MVQVKAFNSEVNIERFLVKRHISNTAPTLVLLAGIHGNEVSGIFAIHNVWKQIQEQNLQFKGNFYALSGNLNAISKNIRYENEDLNRLWTDEHLQDIRNNKQQNRAEDVEQRELYFILKDILATHAGEFFFIDLHTTSSPTTPFITISDSINNRCFSSRFPVPVVLGIEEYIHGPLLTYINKFGHIGVGFEAGQHQDKEAIKINEAFIWMVLVETGCLQQNGIKDYDKNYKILNQLSSFKGQFFEIDYKHSIKKDEKFEMLEGFSNFQKINKKEALAISNGTTLFSPLNARIFMPLYQNQGEDGYFIVTHISKFWMLISRYMRKMQLHHLLRLLPGIQQSKENKYILVINPKTAKYLTNEIFHLFGYRRKISRNGKLYFSKRDRKIRAFE